VRLQEDLKNATLLRLRLPRGRSPVKEYVVVKTPLLNVVPVVSSPIDRKNSP